MKKIKIIITIFLSLLGQIEAVRENGSWGLGGNIFIPVLCFLAFWIFPEMIKTFVKEIKKEL